MRALWIVVASVVVVACRSAPTPEPISNAVAPTVEVKLDIDRPLQERLALGLPLELELRLLSTDAAVGTCTLSFDLWDEVYRVALSRNDVATAHDATLALRRCVDMRRLQQLQATGTAHVGVREVPAQAPLYQPPEYPIF